MSKPTKPILKIADAPQDEKRAKRKPRKRRAAVQRLAPGEMDAEIARVRFANQGLTIFDHNE